MARAGLLYVSGEYPPDVGGVGDYTANLRRTLAELGRPSGVLTRAQVRRWDARALLALLRAAPRAGIVHVQFQAAAFDLLGDICLAPRLLRSLCRRVLVVTTFHDTRVPYLFPKAGALRVRAVRLLADSSHAVLAADRRDLHVLGGPSPRHHYVPIGSNVACSPPRGYDRAQFRGALGLGEHDLVVVYFGLLNLSKGLDLLLDAFEVLHTINGTARLMILGGAIGASDPTDRRTANAVQRRLARLGSLVIRRTWLPGQELSAYLLAGDVALLPYSDGASGRRGSLLACAAHGLPIVSTWPVAPELAGAVVGAPPSAVELANAVRAAQADRARFSDESRALVETSMSWPRIAARHLCIYESVLDSGS